MENHGLTRKTSLNKLNTWLANSYFAELRRLTKCPWSFFEPFFDLPDSKVRVQNDSKMKLDLPIHLKRKSFSELREPIIEPEDGSSPNRRKDLAIFIFTVVCCLLGIFFVFTSLYIYTESIDRFEERLTEKITEESVNLTEAFKNKLVEDEQDEKDDSNDSTEATKILKPGLNCKCGLDYEPGFIPWQVSIASVSENETNHQCSGKHDV